MKVVLAVVAARKRCSAPPSSARGKQRAAQGFAPIAIGLGLTLIHLVSIPVTGTSVNPARSTGPAVFVGGWALAQLWLFWVAPLAGAALGGIVYRAIGEEK
jgi:aquaporin Z